MTDPRAPLSEVEKERLYREAAHGKTQGQIAGLLECSVSCVRKWCRRLREEGLAGLRPRPRGRRPQGLLSTFAEAVRQAALALKRQHPRWGGVRVRIALQQESALTGLKLPSANRLAVYFKQACPAQVTVYTAHSKRGQAPVSAHAVHEVWQLDSQENIRLHDGDIATICNIRDPVGAAILASQAFSVKAGTHYRKLTWTEVRGVLRQAFTEWHTLPDAVQTDNELGLAGQPTDTFPSWLTLWLVGLGIPHRFIRPGRPTDQPHIERTHRTLDDLALDETSRANLTQLQAALDRERSIYNQQFPSQASHCGGRPPLEAYPALRQPRRPYDPQTEWALFDMQRIYTFLATFTFERRVTSSGQIRLGTRLYYVGRTFAHRTVLVSFDRQMAMWSLATKTDAGIGSEIARRTPVGLDFQTLSGLEPHSGMPAFPVQLSFPCFIA